MILYMCTSLFFSPCTYINYVYIDACRVVGVEIRGEGFGGNNLLVLCWLPICILLLISCHQNPTYLISFQTPSFFFCSYICTQYAFLYTILYHIISISLFLFLYLRTLIRTLFCYSILQFFVKLKKKTTQHVQLSLYELFRRINN